VDTALERSWSQVCLDRGKQYAVGVGNPPISRVPDDQGLAKDVEAGGARRDARHSIRPVSPAGNQQGDVASKIRKRKEPTRGAGQNLQNCDLETHATDLNADSRNLSPVVQLSP
jgi:hypothetical protein